MAEKERNDANTGKSEGKPGHGKRILLRTFGCQMNDRDTELVYGLLLKHGYTKADTSENADVILFNGCSVRKKAEDKVWSEIGRLKLLSSEFRGKGYTARGATKRPADAGAERRAGRASRSGRKIVGLIGCMAENYKEKSFERSPLLDLVVGPNNIAELPVLIERVMNERGRQFAVGKARRDESAYNTGYINDVNHANVIIMEGCDNFCTYCVVPYVRGRERSRRPQEIIAEISGLVARGVKEITLLGQNVNSYHYTDQDPAPADQVQSPGKGGDGGDSGRHPVTFIDLLKLVNDIEGLVSFNFVTSHPKDASEELFRTMAALPKLQKFLHLPVQAGSDRILKLMNRGYTRAHYLELVRSVRRYVPDIRLSTDVMVGFPTETDDDFQDTYDLLKEVGFSSAYVFKYSPRPHAQSSLMPDDVPEAVKKRRNQILLNYQKKIFQNKNNG